MSQDKKAQNTRPSEPAAASRRKALRRLLVGSGVVAGSKVIPEKWSAPVIDAVVLPAHAESSPDTPVFKLPKMEGP